MRESFQIGKKSSTCFLDVWLDSSEIEVSPPTMSASCTDHQGRLKSV